MQARLLLRPALRTIRWVPLAVIAAAGFLIVWSGLRHGGDARAQHLPLAGALLAVWIGFLLDDPAAESVASVPLPLVSRRGVRILLAVPAIGLAWMLLSLQADIAGKAVTLTTAFAAQVVVALGFAAVGTRVSGDERGGPVAVAGLFFVFLVLPLLLKVPMTLDPLTDSWHHLYGRWVWLGGAGLLLFLAASADPGRRGPVSWLRGRRARPEMIATEASS